jgi:hypothetical protein
VRRPQAPRNLGLTLIALGTLALAAAAWQHPSFMNQIGGGSFTTCVVHRFRGSDGCHPDWARYFSWSSARPWPVLARKEISVNNENVWRDHGFCVLSRAGSLARRGNLNPHTEKLPRANASLSGYATPIEPPRGASCRVLRVQECDSAKRIHSRRPAG